MPMEEKLIRKRKTVRRQTRKRRSSQRADVARELALAVDRPFDGDAVPRRKRECSGRRREIEKQQDELKGYWPERLHHTCDLKATELGTEREPQCAHGFGCNPHLVHVSWFLSQVWSSSPPPPKAMQMAAAMALAEEKEGIHKRGDNKECLVL
ncbi:hypothetical protein BHM03_00002889 [Ensete ventricosum]|uniref:Uncharacterized protein n=1 Tax=Ensete ventricosum TaxID=4639 RepID=A0A445M9V8_ENSVE|nr:hypothetical protein BHM03_00002889 [Ensete ventricosum]